MDAMAAASGKETVTVATSARDNRWTLAALGVLGYMVSNVLHEGLGHGGAAWLSGAHRIVLTSTYMDAGFDTRWILAAGTLVNLGFGLLGLAALRTMRGAGPVARLLVWAITAYNLLEGSGYFLYSGISGQGDWAEWMKGLTPLWGWHAGSVVLGVVLYLVSQWLLARELVEIAGGEEARLRRLAWTIYFAGGIAACVAGARNPQGWKMVVLSAVASSMGGASGLLWIADVGRGVARRLGRRDTVPVTIPAAPVVWAAAAVLLAVFVWWLGPGVTLRFG